MMKYLEAAWRAVVRLARLARREPVRTLTLIQALAAAAASFGLELSPDQLQGVWIVFTLLLGANETIRAGVTPTTKLLPPKDYDEPGAGLKGI